MKLEKISCGKDIFGQHDFSVSIGSRHSKYVGKLFEIKIFQTKILKKYFEKTPHREIGKNILWQGWLAHHPHIIIPIFMIG